MVYLTCCKVHGLYIYQCVAILHVKIMFSLAQQYFLCTCNKGRVSFQLNLLEDEHKHIIMGARSQKQSGMNVLLHQI